MQTIYLDVLFGVNLLVDYLLLMVTARLAGIHATRPRAAAGAAVGAAYAAACVLWPAGILGMLPVQLAAGFLMVYTAFGKHEKRVLGRIFVLFLVCSALFAGFTVALYLITGTYLRVGNAYYLEVPMRIVIGACAIGYVICGFLFRGSAKHGAVYQTTETVSITCFGRTDMIHMLVDSGNDLTDPVTGRPVLILEWQAAAKLFPAELMFLCTGTGGKNAADLLAEVPETYRAKFRLLPYRSVGGQGMLIMFRPDEIRRAKGRKYDGYAAISAERIAGGRYQGLIGL